MDKITCFIFGHEYLPFTRYEFACWRCGKEKLEQKETLKNKKVLILGSTGMLGSMVTDYLSKKDDLKVTAFTRKDMDKSFKGYDYIINCVGIIKQKLTNPEEAIKINSLFPYEIERRKSKNCKVIQIATDCVFSGKKGKYTETDEHDAIDVYGKTKSLGEVKSFINIRTSIIGPSKDKVSLLEWFLSQKKNAVIQGYSNHYWNGVTTLEFAKLCYFIIQRGKSEKSFHYTPRRRGVSKYKLLKIIAKSFNREDIKITKYKTERIDRTLSTIYKYVSTLTIDQMIKELADYDYENFGVRKEFYT